MAGLLGRLFRRRREELRCSAVVPAAGSSTRMGQDKLLLPLGEQPVLLHTLRALELCPYITEIVVVTREELIVPIGQLCRDAALEKVRKVIVGGATRSHSVLAGLEELSPDAELAAIHDGARPLVSQAVLEAVIRRASECGAAAPAVPVKDTVKMADEAGLVESTPPREKLFAMQTPQCFDRAAYLALAGDETVTDDCQLFEQAGRPVQLVAGEYENYKITTPDDLKGEKAMRIGHGYDVHKLVEGRDLILGGVKIPYEKGLLGHSDADVLTHAVMDALLGAAALGDIGKHFPDSDPAYKGADSLALARHVAALLAEKGWRPVNVDSTILCQAPKLAPHIPAMAANLAAALGMEAGAVSVKATTEEHLGFTGQGLGIAAHAVALLEKANV